MVVLFLAVVVSLVIGQNAFIRIDGPNLIAPNGEKFNIRGTNLGNWLNPEGYMFGFDRTTSPGRINWAFREMVGPDFTDQFWKIYKDNYVTRDDIQFLGRIGCTTIRVPFNYRLFTEEDYMGLTHNQDGFERFDTLVSWAKEAGLYLILDMHDAPGGQTGDNIDDSYGYPWLFDSEDSQKSFFDVWTRIADHFKNESTILGYELMNEPIAPYFDVDSINPKLEPLYKQAVSAIRTVDTDHIILFGGAQWNGNFGPLTPDASFDPNIMYTCHRYGGDATASAISDFINFRNRVNRPMYMGEIGHGTNEWMGTFRRVLDENNIGWTYWPYKKIQGSSFVSIPTPQNWSQVVTFVDSQRLTYEQIRNARPNQDTARNALLAYAENSKLEHCSVDDGYLQALGLRA